jgi:hypothetical protein
MGFFKKLQEMFGGRAEADSGLYYYIKLKRGGEIVRIRLEPSFELVPNYDSEGYTTRKTVVGPKTFQRAEAMFYFTASRMLDRVEVDGGEMADESEWLAQQQSQEAKGGS